MSAALQLPVLWALASPAIWPSRREYWHDSVPQSAEQESGSLDYLPESLAFYRKHTERLLRRYMYASMQIGRSPSIFGDPVSRGWASSRPVRTFEDAVIFVLDIEKCLARLNPLDRQILSRVVLQEYTQAEAASLIGMCVRTISSRFPRALDRLTQLLHQADLLVLPK